MDDLIDFREEYEASGDFAHFKGEYNRYVPGRGSERPKAMLLVGPPGATDSYEGKPFAGQPGRVLDQLMELAGLYAIRRGAAQFANNAYITSTVKYRLSGTHTLTWGAMDLSLKWVLKEWEILHRPPVIVAIGIVPTRCLLGRDSIQSRLSDLAGSPRPIADGGPTVWPMISPAQALQRPEIRPKCEEHWQALGAWLKEEGLV